MDQDLLAPWERGVPGLVLVGCIAPLLPVRLAGRWSSTAGHVLLRGRHAKIQETAVM